MEQPLRNLKHEAFCQTLIKYKGNGSKAYGEIYNVKEASARVNASRLLAQISIRIRIAEILENERLTLKVILKELKKYLKKRKFKKPDGTTGYAEWPPPYKLEAIRILLRLHGLLGNQIQLSPEQVELFEQIGGNLK